MAETYKQKKKRLEGKIAAGKRKLKELDEHSALAKKFMEAAKKPIEKPQINDGPKKAYMKKKIAEDYKASSMKPAQGGGGRMKYTKKPRRGRKISV